MFHARSESMQNIGCAVWRVALDDGEHAALRPKELDGLYNASQQARKKRKAISKIQGEEIL